MKRTLLLTLLSVALLAAADRTFTGVITDTMCGKSHEMMGNQPADKCVAMCVKGSSQYALYDGKTVYALSDQKSAARFAGKPVKITGSLNDKSRTIKVTTIEAN